MIVTYLGNAPTCLIHAKYYESDILKEKGSIPMQDQKFNLDPTIIAAQYKLPKQHDELGDRHKVVKQSNKILKTSWPQYLTLQDDCSA